MNKQKKLIKKLGILFVMLIMSVTVLSTTIASAATAPTVSFSFAIPELGALTKTTQSYKRNTDTVNDAWAITFETSNEPALLSKTKSTFWLGVNNPSGVNPMGSKKYIVKEGSGWENLTALPAASQKYVLLYASDNGTTNDEYSAGGRWTPNSGNKPNR